VDDRELKETIMTRDIRNLLNHSRSEGTLSDESHQILSLPDLGAKIQQGLGVLVDDIPASEVFLLTLLVDDSGSISAAKNDALVMQGTNAILAALQTSQQADGILVHTRYLNGTVLTPYAPVAQADRLTAANYSATGGTPLYDESVAILGTVLTKTQEFTDAGVPVRTVTVIITDGADCGSQRHDARAVRSLVADLRAAERHIVAAVGLSDGSTDFRDVFRSMGIDEQWILTPGASEAEIRAAFRMIGQSAMRTSQYRGSFSQAVAGGFG
jgi:hypothetical protein